MTYSRSFSPNGIQRPNPDYEMCGGMFHATTAAKVVALIQFISCLAFSGFNFYAFGADKGWLSLFCFAFTCYSVLVIYGVFLEKKSFILPLLITQLIVAIGCVSLLIVYAGLGIFTDFIPEHHRENEPLRDLYRMHALDPDDEIIQTAVSSGLLFSMIALTGWNLFVWWAMWRTYKCYDEADHTIVPRDGYSRGIVADPGNDYE